MSITLTNGVLTNGNLQTFTPLAISDIQRWIESSDFYTLKPLNGDTASEWRDKSGAGNDATQSTAVNQPLYDPDSFGGLPSILFNGSNSVMSFDSSISNTGPFSIFLVLNSNDYANFAVAYTANGADNFIGITSASKIWIAADIDPGGSTNDSTVDFPQQNNILYLQRDGNGKWDLSVNGGAFNRLFGDVAKPATQNWGAIGDDGIGGGIPWSGPIAELIHYDKEVSSSERAKMISYLSNKWSVSI